MSENRRNLRQKKIIKICAAMVGLYAGMRWTAQRYKETQEIDSGNIYIHGHDGRKKSFRPSTVYEIRIKPLMDRILSFMALLVFSPLFVIISLAIYIDDPGPVFFCQTRIGKNKKFFALHKFRSMKVATPHDVPTHQLEDPDQYITRVGKILRRTSLDELPQIWDIFRGRMSVIGPRPALWNQEDLVAEREKYGANDVMPGLTGWAQINGRDELEIAEKARLDGEYTAILRSRSLKGFALDVKCFVKTVVSVLKSDGVVEGGTGELKKGRDRSGFFGRHILVRPDEAGFEEYGYRKTFYIDTGAANRKTVLITGADSYIGENFRQYAVEHYGKNFSIDTLDMRNSVWREKDFSSYDTVFHVAGIAHADIGHVDEATKERYYAVNRDLAVETAKKAKAEGVRQFILMSSMIIYGDSVPIGQEKVIDEHTLPAPANFYGDSKWQAEKIVRRLGDENFHVAVLRPPMIYGKGSKGNYPKLASIAKKLPVFPDVKNSRSMLYIENLCEFLCLLLLSGEGGVYFPQNGECAATSRIVETICKTIGKKIYLSKTLNWAATVACKMPGKIGNLAVKGFGNAVYSKELSEYKGINYQKKNLEDSIWQIERKSDGEAEKPSVLILVNHDVVIYNFRLELVERLLHDGYEVHISSPYGERIDDLVALGAKYHSIDIERHGMNPIQEFHLLAEYNRLIKLVCPLIVFGYTIKPNIYGAMAAKVSHIPFVANITGLGTSVENNGVRQKFILLLYKIAFTDIQRIFFQNKENMRFFSKQRIGISKHILLPGSGVNLNKYQVTSFLPCENGKEGEPVKFAFISRIMEEKGINQYLTAAEKISKKYPNTEFHVCGFCEDEYEGRLQELHNKGTVIYHGMIRDVAGFMSKMHCIVHPTYYPEGLSNVLLEASACGRPIITTDRPGCREVLDHNGYLITERCTKELIEAIEKFIGLTQAEKEAMGAAGRKLVEQKFDRQIVVEKYMDEIRIAEQNVV